MMSGHNDKYSEIVASETRWNYYRGVQVMLFRNTFLMKTANWAVIF